MIVLGLALTLVAAAATVFAVIASTTTSVTIALSALGVTISVSPLALFVAGALSVILLSLGFALINRGTRGKARRHGELKRLRKESAATATRTTADENRKAGAGTLNDTRKGAEESSEQHPDTGR